MTATHDGRQLVFQEDFDGTDLDRSVWVPHYLPAWSSRAETAATYGVHDSCLQLSITPEQGLWCAPDHQPPIRVSGIQSGNFSGPVGTTLGQQPYREGLTVREEQDELWGWTPDHGYVEMRARCVVSPRSMAAFWMVGLEKQPQRSAEICVFEVFGKDVVAGRSAAVGMGLHRFRDPQVAEDFEAPRLEIDVAELHDYAVDWGAETADFFVDGRHVRSCPRPPRYPMQLMVAVFDFPGWSDGSDAGAVPELVVDHVRGYA